MQQAGGTAHTVHAEIRGERHGRACCVRRSNRWLAVSRRRGSWSAEPAPLARWPSDLPSADLRARSTAVDFLKCHRGLLELLAQSARRYGGRRTFERGASGR